MWIKLATTYYGCPRVRGAAGVSESHGYDIHTWIYHYSASMTPLMLAAWRGRADVADIVIEFRADIQASNDHGFTVKDFSDQLSPSGALKLDLFG